MVDVGGTPVVATSGGDGGGLFGGAGFLGGLIFGDLLWRGQSDSFAALSAGQAALTSAIDNAKYDLTINMNAGFSALADKFTQDELREAYAKISEQGQMLSEQRIISAMKPQNPVPAYVVDNPYTGGNFYGC